MSFAPAYFHSRSYKPEGHADQHEHDGAEKRRPEPPDTETRHERTRQPQNKCVDDKEEDAERDDAERQRQNLEHKSERHVQQADDQRRDERTAEAGKFKPRDEISDDQQRNRAEKPDQQQVEHTRRA